MKILALLICLIVILKCCEGGFIGPSGEIGRSSLTNRKTQVVTSAVRSAANQVQSQTGQPPFAKFQSVIYATQLYNDIFYFIKVQVSDDANGYAHIRARLPLITFFNFNSTRNAVLEALETGHTLQDPIKYMDPSLNLVGGVINIQNGVLSDSNGRQINLNNPNIIMQASKNGGLRTKPESKRTQTVPPSKYSLHGTETFDY
ncbi:hypothetical protein PPL_12200 [Heterostelium album PN500]|uniref:Uncharacterized protein n=1 Tax=Heterostelium pallidum (strain ATCC 26659 / Pp 5 / PN500) TaxID=670386 RepID=D3BLZ3_HETP5|nr:hypothetical protein PPL_12200 [Heterostelium album PN500]EFA77594.1 hypothetical protein PPL_12200 [Heterostelium album PN500]|eukprot:XP_020429722.1 hypothetical protein PPL_12200 [Heterostelium album PN500]